MRYLEDLEHEIMHVFEHHRCSLSRSKSFGFNSNSGKCIVSDRQKSDGDGDCKGVQGIAGEYSGYDHTVDEGRRASLEHGLEI